MPASPATVKRTQRLSPRAASNAARSAASSSSRPTSGVSNLRASPGAPSISSSTRNAVRSAPLRPAAADGVPDEPLRRRRDEHLAAAGGLLQPLGERHGGAGHERVAASTCEDLAGADADADREPLVGFRRRGVQVERRPYCPERVVLVRLGHAEHGHDRVADELLHGAAVGLDRRPCRREVPAEQRMGRLGIESFDETRRIDEIGEQDGHRAPGDRRRRHGRRHAERRVVPEDRLLELPERRPGLEPELLVELSSRLLVGLERLRLPSGAVERQHQLPAQALVEGVLLDEELELGDEVGVAPELELGVDQLLARREAELLEPRDLECRERLVGDVGERRAAPEPERLAEAPGALGDVGGRARLGAEPLEAAEVDLVGRDVEHVPGVPGDEHVRPQRLAQERDVVLERVPAPSAAGSRPRAPRSGGRARPARGRAGAAPRGARGACASAGRPTARRPALRAGRELGIPLCQAFLHPAGRNWKRAYERRVSGRQQARGRGREPTVFAGDRGRSDEAADRRPRPY